jgi:hypothetical protein
MDADTLTLSQSAQAVKRLANSFSGRMPDTCGLAAHEDGTLWSIEGSTEQVIPKVSMYMYEQGLPGLGFQIL